MKPVTPEELARELALHGRHLSSAERAQLRAKQQAARLGNLFMSGEGKELMDMLEDMYYNGKMVGATPEDTYFNLGRRDVVHYLRQLRDAALKEK